MNWSLDLDEFAYLWSEIVADLIPYPLSIRTSARTQDERDPHRLGLRRWFDTTDDTDLRVAFGI
ncbi:MAG: ESX secretion-associated protein EspG, partial [Aldersonia sp.]|nr:ESX secretion-associated protein EspG [Aldersonia sp.]